MRLKRIELIGFKSFADKTQVVFDQGVTCIVGPNGCGKSNISDAMRWVLGERSAKLLRGNKMEDVIFSGTSLRKPQSLAEVSLTFENEDRRLPIDYNEVTLTRRLYRSGESEYLINKTKCRLKDIFDLIMDTGIGSNSYSMIEQGRIDYILRADAQERRFLIEEAAGISKYKAKKEEAIRKLDRTEANRVRLNDIVQEVERNIQYSERQARRAARYKEQFEKLKSMEISRAFHELSELASERTSLEKLHEELRTKLDAIERGMREKRKIQEDRNETLRGILDRYRAEEAERYALQSKIEAGSQQLKFHQEKRMEMASRRGQISQEQAQINERLTKNESEIVSKKEELAKLTEERSKAEEIFAEFKAKLDEIEKELEAAKQSYNQAKTNAVQAAAETTKVRNDYHRLVSFVETSHEHKRKQEAGAKRLKQEANEVKEKRQSHANELAHVEVKIQELAKAQATAEENESKIRQGFLREQQMVEGLRRELHETEARLNLLNEINNSAHAGQSTILESLEAEEKEQLKALRDIFEIKPGYEWAVETALAHLSKSLIAENIEIAEKLGERILDQKPGPFSFFVKGVSKPMKFSFSFPKSKHPAIECTLRDVVKIKAGYEDIFDTFLDQTYLLHPCSTSLLFKAILPMAQDMRFISREGLVLGPENKVLFYSNEAASEESTFQREAEIRKLEKNRETLSSEVNLHDLIAQGLENHLREIGEDRAVQDKQRLDLMMQKEGAESHLSGMKDRLSSFEKELQLVMFDQDEMDGQVSEAREQMEARSSELAACESREKEILHSQDLMNKSIEEWDEKKGTALQEFTESRTRFDQIQESTQLLSDSVSLIEEHAVQDKDRLQQLQEENTAMDTKTEELRVLDIKLEEEQVTFGNKLREYDVALELIRQEKAQAEEELQAAQNAVEKLLSEQHGLQDESHTREMRTKDIDYKEKSVSERLAQTYRLNLADFKAEDYPLEMPLEELDEKLEGLRKKVESLGTVNMLAIEEYEELKSRYDFLMEQQRDLDEARDILLETIRKINRTTKGLFVTTYDRVQQAFQEYYQTLFRGGSAKLVLIDETNPLESGIDIVVRPPGKKLQNINLLSGGEKALTAIALLFALFKIKPSPFCVLDEVDAPLDEANIDRFLSVLRTFLQSSQFIIVTHNRKTIGMGDALYGVTMQEAGVSRLVSVKVNQEEEQAVGA